MIQIRIARLDHKGNTSVLPTEAKNSKRDREWAQGEEKEKGSGRVDSDDHCHTSSAQNSLQAFPHSSPVFLRASCDA